MRAGASAAGSVLDEVAQGRVVVVGQQSAIVEVVTAVLDLDGHRSHVVTDAEEGVACAQRGRYDLIVFTSVCEVRGQPQALGDLAVRAFEGGIPVILMSVLPCAEPVLERLRQARWPAFFVSKPSSLDDLRETAWRALRYGWLLRLRRACERDLADLRAWAEEAPCESSPTPLRGSDSSAGGRP